MEKEQESFGVGGVTRDVTVTLDQFLDQVLQEELKGFEDTHHHLQAAAKRFLAGVREGNLDSMNQSLSRYEELLSRQVDGVSHLKERLPSFKVVDFLQQLFHEGFVAALAEENLPVVADYPVYEVFPFKVRVTPERESIMVGEKTIRTLRPKVVAQRLRQEIKRLHALPFDGARFLQSLADAYDLLMCRLSVTKKIALSEQEVLLKDVYNVITPLPHQKRAYPQRLFAFDLYRLLQEGSLSTADGRRLWLGNVRSRARAMVILDAQGRPQRYGVMKFYREG